MYSYLLKTLCFWEEHHLQNIFLPNYHIITCKAFIHVNMMTVPEKSFIR